LEVGDQLLALAHVAFDRDERRLVALRFREREELAGVPQPRVDLLQRSDGRLERAPFLAQVLRALRVGPDVGILERARDLDQARLLRVVVKDTSAARPRAPRGPGGCAR